MKFSKSLSKVMAFSLLVLSQVGFALKVGTVDFQRGLHEVKKGKVARASLEKEFDEKKKEIEKEQATIQKMGEEFQKTSLVMTEKARVDKSTEIQKRMAAFQEKVQKSQMEIQSREGELTKPIIEGLRSMVADLAKKQDLELVFEMNSVGPGGSTASALAYSKEKVDLTDELIKAFDKKNR